MQHQKPELSVSQIHDVNKCSDSNASRKTYPLRSKKTYYAVLGKKLTLEDVESCFEQAESQDLIDVKMQRHTYSREILRFALFEGCDV